MNNIRKTNVFSLLIVGIFFGVSFLLNAVPVLKKVDGTIWLNGFLVLAVLLFCLALRKNPISFVGFRKISLKTLILITVMTFLGMPFINVWLGDGFRDVYILTNILLFPALFELCINVCLSVLRAKNMLKFRTAVIAISAIINLLVMLISMPYIGYFGASIGTACSYFFGSVVIMGVYYYKKLKNAA